VSAQLPREFPILDAGAVRLRAITRDDADDYFAVVSDPAVIATTSMEAALDVGEVRDAIERWGSSFAAGTSIRWAIADPESGHLIGTCGFNSFDVRAARAEIGYEVARAWWGRGVATAAAGAVCAFGFDALRLHRIEATVMAGNAASARVLEKLGFRREGRLRDYKFARGAWSDYWMYARLAI
jgi:ribosomal-protein-alanine N-acetyltransferase